MWYNMRCSREHKKHKDKDWNMNGFTSIEDAREYFSKDRFATDNAITLEELDEEHSLCSMQIGSGHRNAYGGVMGGAIFTLADFAFAALTNGRENVTVAQQVSINFLSAPKGSRLFAKADYRKNGRSSCVVTVEVGDDTGRDIALFTGTGFKMKQG
jgi:acyl-CoA thioesterase